MIISKKIKCLNGVLKIVIAYAAKVEITATYGREEAIEVIRRSQADYNKNFGVIDDELSKATLSAFRQS